MEAGLPPPPGVNAQPVLGRQVKRPLVVSEWVLYTSIQVEASFVLGGRKEEGGIYYRSLLLVWSVALSTVGNCLLPYWKPREKIGHCCERNSKTASGLTSIVTYHHVAHVVG